MPPLFFRFSNCPVFTVEHRRTKIKTHASMRMLIRQALIRAVIFLIVFPVLRIRLGLCIKGRENIRSGCVLRPLRGLLPRFCGAAA